MLNYVCLKKKSVWLSLILRIIVSSVCIFEEIFLIHRLPTSIYICFVCFCVFSWMCILGKANQLSSFLYRRSKYGKKLLLLISDILFPWLEIKALCCSELPAQVVSLWQKDIYTSIAVFFENEFEVPEVKKLLFELEKRGIAAEEYADSKEEKVAHLDINNAGNLIKTELSIDRLLMFSETNEKNGFDEEFRWKLIINSEGTRLFCYEKELDAAWVDEESVADEIAKAILLLNGRERRRK